MGQVSAYLSALKIREYGRLGDITLESLRQATLPYRLLPISPDDGYVIDANFDGSDENKGKFCIAWSTQRMSTSFVGNVIHSDCTYKCVWNGYPITMMGFSDKDRKFHPVILAVSTYETQAEFLFILQAWLRVNPSLNPKYLMADASEAVFNAAKLIWPNVVRLMCYAHVYMVSSPARTNRKLYALYLRSVRDTYISFFSFLKYRHELGFFIFRNLKY